MNRRESLRAGGAIAALGGLGTLGKLSVGSLFFQAASARAQGEADEARLLRTGPCVVMLRHAQTDPGMGDPPDFDLAQCRTQRNLSEQGRA